MVSEQAEVDGNGVIPPLVEVTEVSRRFGGVQAVNSVSLSLRHGEVLGIIGPNGAGKTTLVNLISGHEQCDSGSIRLGGATLIGQPIHAIARLGVARTFQNIRLARELSVLDNVVIGHHLHRRSDTMSSLLPTASARRARAGLHETACGLLALVGLDPKAVSNRMAGTLAYGDQRRVEIARALAAKPRVLLLDEPAAGMNRVEKARLRDLLTAIVAGNDLALILIEHDVRLVMEMCDRIAVLNFGCKIAEGTPAEIATHPEVLTAYLGTTAAAKPPPPPAVAQSGRHATAAGDLLEVRDLHVAYGAIRAVRGVSFSVHEGEFVTLIGANGAGKSSILRALSGVIPATGHAHFRGRDRGIDLTRTRSPKIVRAGLVQVPEGREILGKLTVGENLALGGWTRPDKQELAREIDLFLQRFPVLGQRRDVRALQLSGGEQQILTIVRALLARPRLLLLDEPSLGLAPLLADDIFAIIRDVHRDGMSILLVEQNAYRALELADRAWVIETGLVALAGSGTELLGDERVRASYLGLEAVTGDR